MSFIILSIYIYLIYIYIFFIYFIYISFMSFTIVHTYIFVYIYIYIYIYIFFFFLQFLNFKFLIIRRKKILPLMSPQGRIVSPSISFFWKFRRVSKKNQIYLLYIYFIKNNCILLISYFIKVIFHKSLSLFLS
ncbi:hypothetical protein H8356DRAFT_255386 [Neocallimastix lanati (nom. inval.)]|nr:hypothetical protein H8356DRAFT_255386 [Neocallimastix sp. JGI-2020a]